jgi:pimeloyl-ACP methyl ester carboxylesterase
MAARPAPAAGAIRDGKVSIGDRSLLLDCEGEGTPVVVFETKSGGGRFSFRFVEEQLVGTTTVCTYDRANLGQSDPAPKPRTAADVGSDLHALLEAAGVPAPYILVGSSAGADFVVYAARRYPEDVAAVVAWNPVLLDPGWGAEIDAATPAAGIESQHRFLSGLDGGELVDWYTSAEQAAALPVPSDVPLVLLQSDETECMDMADCIAVNPTFLRLGAEFAAQWPGAEFSAVAQEHLLDEGDPELVAGLLEKLVASSRSGA